MKKLDIKNIRVGNLLDYEATTHSVISIDGLTKTIDSWWINHETNRPVIEFDNDHNYMPYSSNITNYKGIPITKKFLKRLGIPYDKNSKSARKLGSNYDYIFYPRGSVRIKFFKGNRFIYTQADGITAVLEDINYIHELQNLIFSLYNYELKLKEKSSTKLISR